VSEYPDTMRVVDGRYVYGAADVLTLLTGATKHEYPSIMTLLAPILPPGTPSGWPAEHGTTVHRIIASRLQNALGIDVPRLTEPDLEGYARAAESFIELEGLIPEHVEQPRIGQVHHLPIYGGTPDLIAKDARGVDTIVEWKTTEPAPWHAVQVEAYAHLVGFRPVAPSPYGVRRLVVYLHRQGTFAMREDDNNHPIDALRGCLLIADWRNAVGL